MTPLDFGYWLRGLCSVPGLGTVDVGAAALKKAKDLNGAKAPVMVVPPSLRTLVVPQFCVHNVNRAEPCAACGATGTRLFCFQLLADTKTVYIHQESPPGENSNG